MPIDAITVTVRVTRALEAMGVPYKETLSSNPQMVANVASPEDTLLAKLEWYRLGGEVSERQWRDVLGVLKVQDPSDLCPGRVGQDTEVSHLLGHQVFDY